MSLEDRVAKTEDRLDKGSGKLARLEVHARAGHLLLQKIEKQVTKTNGRVTKMEKIIAAVKWVVIGVLASGLAQHFGFWEAIARIVK